MKKLLLLLSILAFVLALTSPVEAARRRAVRSPSPDVNIQVDVITKNCESPNPNCEVYFKVLGPLPTGVHVSSKIFTPADDWQSQFQTTINNEILNRGAFIGNLHEGIAPQNWGSGCAGFSVTAEIYGQSSTDEVYIPVGNYTGSCNGPLTSASQRKQRSANR